MSHTKRRDIAILGGTFDPIHLGHILPANEIIKWLGIDELILMPAHIPPHKSAPTTSSHVRAEMVELVCKRYKHFVCDTRELNREKPSYTVDTLKELKREHPNSRLFFLMGMDSLLSFTKWHQWQVILKHCHLVVSTRPGYEKASMTRDTQQLLDTHQSTIQQLGDLDTGKILFAPECRQDISSTNIRDAIICNSDFDDYLTPEVASYIHTNQLYLHTNKSH